jgi:hypothetical protein
LHFPNSGDKASAAWKTSKTFSFQVLPILGAIVGVLGCAGSALQKAEADSERARKEREAERDADFASANHIRKDSLLRTVEEINRFAALMGARIPTRYEDDLRIVLEKEWATSQPDPRRLNHFFEVATADANLVLNGTKGAAVEYQAVRAAYDTTVRAVARSGSHVLIRELELIDQGLRSEALLGLLASRQWHLFSSCLQECADEIKRLSENAASYEAGATDIDEFQDESDLDRACRLLGVPSNSSPDKIKRVYLALVDVWHTDRPDHPDDAEERMKELNWARDCLLKRTTHG